MIYNISLIKYESYNMTHIAPRKSLNETYNVISSSWSPISEIVTNPFDQFVVEKSQSVTWSSCFRDFPLIIYTLTENGSNQTHIKTKNMY